MYKDISITEIDGMASHQKYLMHVNGKSFYVGDFFGKIVSGLKCGLDPHEIAKNVNRSIDEGGKCITAAQVEYVIENKIKPILSEKKTSGSLQASMFTNILLKKDFLYFKQMKPVLEGLKYLFIPYIFIPVFLALIAMNYHYMNGSGSLTAANILTKKTSECYRGFVYLGIFYPVATLILLMHEIGHAAAAYLFKIKPKSIGFGLYFIFPVLYTDISEVWSIKPWKRLVVNSAGIFMQLIINACLLYWTYHSPNPEVRAALTYVMIVNIGIVYVNIIPFLKFDGYWIYSDLTRLPNLQNQASAWWMIMIKKVFPKMKVKISENTLKLIDTKNAFLLFYSVGRALFLIYFFAKVFPLIFVAFNSCFLAIRDSVVQGCTICNMENLLNSSLSVSIIIFAFYINFKKFHGVAKAYVQNKKALRK